MGPKHLGLQPINFPAKKGGKCLKYWSKSEALKYVFSLFRREINWLKTQVLGPHGVLIARKL
jgi:hypothetical protein